MIVPTLSNADSLDHAAAASACCFRPASTTNIYTVPAAAAPPPQYAAATAAIACRAAPMPQPLYRQTRVTSTKRNNRN